MTGETETSELLVETRADGIEIVTLNRPKALNALSPSLANALHAHFTGLMARPEVRVVVLRGEGRAFCAGADLASGAFVPDGPGQTQWRMAQQQFWSGIIRAMRACPQPIIGLIQGPASGGGLSLAVACDVRFAASDARFNAAYVRVGLGGCDMGSGYFLPRLVGHSLASEMMLTGNFIGAERALAAGLVSRVVPGEELLAAGLALADDMLRTAPMALRMTKETLGQTIDAPSLDAALTMEDRAQVILLGTEDHKTAVKAFFAKERPVFRDA